MASRKNDELVERTVEGTINLYSNGRCQGTASDMCLGSLLGGHNYNILSGSDRDEIYYRDLRNPVHIVDSQNRATKEFFGARRRKFEGDERKQMVECLAAPADHPKHGLASQQRRELQLAQMENSRSWCAFQERANELMGTAEPRRYSVHNKRYANEVEKFRPRSTSKALFVSRRGENMTHASSCPSLALHDPAGSLRKAAEIDTRKQVSQRQTESAHFAPWRSASAVQTSMDQTAAGRNMMATYNHCSVNRLENNDFSVTRKNNHYSAGDKISRSDAYFMPPRLGVTNNSVKYDIVSNERKWFQYA